MQISRFVAVVVGPFCGLAILCGVVRADGGVNLPLGSVAYYSHAEDIAALPAQGDGTVAFWMNSTSSADRLTRIARRAKRIAVATMEQDPFRVHLEWTGGTLYGTKGDDSIVNTPGDLGYAALGDWDRSTGTLVYSRGSHERTSTVLDAASIDFRLLGQAEIIPPIATFNPSAGDFVEPWFDTNLTTVRAHNRVLSERDVTALARMPEPVTIALLALGGLSMMMTLRR